MDKNGHTVVLNYCSCFFGKFFGLRGRHFEANISMNWQGQEVVLPLKALKYLHI